MKTKFFLRRLVVELYQFKKEYERGIKLGLATAAVFLLSGLLFGLVINQLSSNHQLYSPIYKDSPSYWNSTEIGNYGEIRLPHDSSGSNQAESSQTSTDSSSCDTITMIGVSAYWDSTLRMRVNAISWGYLAAGTQKSYIIYIFNYGTGPATLSISTSNWNPPNASSYLTLTWSYSGQSLYAGATVPVTLTLTASQNITGIDQFNFDITIEARD